jgi:hypothetical protein
MYMIAEQAKTMELHKRKRSHDRLLMRQDTPKRRGGSFFHLSEVGVYEFRKNIIICTGSSKVGTVPYFRVQNLQT